MAVIFTTHKAADGSVLSRTREDIADDDIEAIKNALPRAGEAYTYHHNTGDEGVFPQVICPAENEPYTNIEIDVYADADTEEAFELSLNRVPIWFALGMEPNRVLGKSRFTWNRLFTHPGTWVGVALLTIGIGMIIAAAAPFLLPAAAAPLLVIAAVASALAVVSLPFYITRYYHTLKLQQKQYAIGQNIFLDSEMPSLTRMAMINFVSWWQDHRVQFGVAAVGVVLFAVALGLTIAFTGGGALFMAPVFAAIAAPLASAGVAFTSLDLMIMSGIVFTVVSLFFANAIKRLAGVVHAELTKNIDLEDRQQQDHHLGAYFDPKNKPQDGLLGALGTVVDGFGEFFHDITHSSKEIPENPVPLIKPPANYDLIM